VRASPGVLDGTIVFEPSPLERHAGAAVNTFDAEVVATVGLDARNLVQESQVRVTLGVVRGLYLRTDGGEDKLVRCSHGSVLDVSVDLRPTSRTYRQWMTVVLDDVAHRSVWLPPGLAHGYQGLTDVADVCCRSTRVHRPEFDAVIRHDDGDLAIPWPLPVISVTDRERNAPALAVVEPMLSDWFGAVR
jgi:dTDP-4-dehydrorhamnose 3,5-epimerase